MAISANEARGLFTSRIIDVFQERIAPKNFIKSFFKEKFTPTKHVQIDVSRTTEKVAVDVIRGSEGNYNRFSNGAQKLYEPPFFREYFNATEFDIYDRVLGSEGTDNTRLFAALLNQVADRLDELRNKILRAQEIQCVQVIETGVVTLVNGDNIDFKRRSESIVNLGSGQYFVNDIDPFAKFKSGAEFLRKFGKVADHTFIAILGDQAITDLFNNTQFKSRQNLFHLSLDDVKAPQLSTSGGTYHGTITCGPYRVQLWTYQDFYQDANGVMQPYINTKKVTMLPVAPRFHFASCLVPQLVMPGTTRASQTGPWVLGDYIDERRTKHDFDIQTAAVPIPVAVDQMYTMQVVG
jgi:hypothetical protein